MKEEKSIHVPVAAVKPQSQPQPQPHLSFPSYEYPEKRGREKVSSQHHGLLEALFPRPGETTETWSLDMLSVEPGAIARRLDRRWQATPLVIQDSTIGGAQLGIFVSQCHGISP
ncbi:uncharacterized protein CLUP02_14957 [Colletotrichum lupini]|uniref:Uncharacterized protein n=1 Tax=Colletotrichum lupini TaxID=145971 RepID=A0A9Q8T799_9PEZI|nr:uncharacterized protein CLUP02_14957 [Colletotrichum lupini]UQC89426.1 hypothetical protein CLUP02_14957 [Colletotrichum lupini]